MNGYEEKKVKIVLALGEAKNPVPVGYICERCGMDRMYGNASVHLDHLEQDGIVHRVSPSTWSASLEPQYELSAETKNLLQQLTATRLEQLIRVRE